MTCDLVSIADLSDAEVSGLLDAAAFAGGYEPVLATGPAADHVVASVTVALDGYAALILIQHPVGESSSQS